METPDLSALSAEQLRRREFVKRFLGPDPWADDDPQIEPLPSAPTNDNNGRYFYLFHRPGDGHKNPAAVRRIVASGGLLPGDDVHKDADSPEGKARKMRPGNWPGFSPRIKRFLDHYMNLKRRWRLAGLATGEVAWFYLNEREGKHVLQFASEDELVFRVPFAWLEYNALFCIEQPPRSSKDRGYIAPRLVMDMRMPLEYRITTSAPLNNEESRVMDNDEVMSRPAIPHGRRTARKKRRPRSNSFTS